MVYSEIDKYSNLLWSAKDPYELCRKNIRGRDTRSGTKSELKEESLKWQKETKATFGYGEITRVSEYFFRILIFNNMINI